MPERTEDENEKEDSLLLEGTVMNSAGGFYEVDIPAEGPQREPIVCSVSGRLKKGRRELAQPVSVGDRVRVRPLDHSGANTRGQFRREGSIEAVLPRERVLARSRYNKTAQVSVANLNQIVIVLAAREPDLNTHRLDRFLILAEANDLEAVICINKVDLLRKSEVEREIMPIAELYRSLGYPVILTSADKRKDLGKDELQKALAGHITAFVGSSGVGKSSLVMMVQPDLLLWVGEIMDIGKGRHTTTDVRLHRLDSGGYIADTPGVKTISLLEQHEVNLEHCFPEIRNLVGKCRFNNCAHQLEPNCAVREAVENGSIAQSRYDSYLRMMEEAEAAKPRYAQKRVL